MISSSSPHLPDGYDRAISAEAAFWGAVARDEAATIAPDWLHRRRLLHNAVVHARHVDALLARVTPGTRVLELGCGCGWLSVALARRGADVLALDVSAEALDVAERYHASIAHTLTGAVEYRVADLNRSVPDVGAAFDLAVAVGVLHHLTNPREIVAGIAGALRPGGHLWVSDAFGHESTMAALVAGALLLVLPSGMPFGEKWRGLRRFGLQAPARVRASMEAEGLSPLEGAGRGVDWLAALEPRFLVTQTWPHPAISGYLACQVQLPQRAGEILLRAIAALDGSLVSAGVWRGSGLTLWATKRPPAPGP